MAIDQRAKFDPKIHHRKSIRLQGYDYTQAGAYFVTIVTYQRDCLFGKIENEIMLLNDFGIIADECWRAIPEHFPNVELGAHVIMPNHAHGVIVIYADDSETNDVIAQHVGATQCVAPTPTITRPTGPKRGSLGAIIGAYKSAVSYRINKEHNATGIWQRNYGACPEPVEGSISSAMRTRQIVSIYISKPTPRNGTMTTRIHQIIGGKIHSDGQRAKT